MNPFISPTATIDPSAFIHPTAIIGPKVTIEANVYVGPYCLIGMPAEYKGRESEDYGVIIHSGSRLTGLVTVDAGVERRTAIGVDCYLMKGCYVAHDCRLENNVTLSSGARIGGNTTLGRLCNVGLNAAIHQRQKIAQGCMIGMGAVITRKLVTEPFRKYAGNPAKDIGENTRCKG